MTGCAPKRIAVAAKPPAALLTCADEPEAPSLPAPGIERDRIVLDFILALRGSYGDCKASVDAIRAWADALPD